MLLDAIFLIPTLFTYGLILLLICILCFIVVYISHKIYISIYDNLPLAVHHGSMDSVDMRGYINSPVRTQRSAPHVASSRSQFIHPTTVRIAVNLEPCYLVGIECDMCPSHRSVTFLCSCDHEAPVCAAVLQRPPDAVRIIRYYDQLHKIPRLKFMLKCNQRPMPSLLRQESSMRITLDNIMRGRRTSPEHAPPEVDSSTACNPPRP
ncbi:uncharacterized protein LOC117893858 isoform X1 [Drosophila subobscura]|uniref:uncharacterized protein LOC117893858 isoform X1 n=1 Tax=Drosophila subobscura TaxID=7241 RepID=UPI00155AB10A|nr:uncharacterized protein LOC117893858 isoform X1 [Drosophila subobscura]